MSLDITAISIRAETIGITEASKALGGLTTSAGNAEKRIDSLVAAMKKLDAVNATSFATMNAQMESLKKHTALLQSLTTNTTASATSTAALTTAIVALSNSVNTLNVNNTRATATQRSHNESMKEAHALARGLSGSLGALWLTYGNFAGMATGVAIGASLKGIVSVGKDVENTLEGIRVKGQETVESVNAIRESVMTIGTGLYGPREVSKAFETLILAGLNAKQALVGIKDALNLATVGGTTIEKAAYTLVQVGTALNYSAEGYGRISDVIAKTAAVSMSSVESLSEAFKSGSVVGKLYGVTLVDIGTSLAALSNLGIQGSAAGTSLKNFYKELSSEAKKLKDALKIIKLTPDSFKDDQGNFLGLIDVVKKLSDGLDALTPLAQKKVMADLANERGMKTLVEVTDLYRRKIQEAGTDAGKYTEKLSLLNKAIEQSYGFTAQGAAAMALTVDAQFKSVKNTLEVTLLKTFQDIQPEISLVARRLKETFASKEFIDGVKSLAIGFANLTVSIVENAGALWDVLRAILAFKAATFILGLLVSMAEGFLAVSRALTAARVTSIAFQASLGLLGLALAAGAAALVWWKTKKEEATEGSKAKAALNYMDDFKGKLDEENIRITEQIKLMESGKKATDAYVESQQKLGLQKVKDQGAAAIASATAGFKSAFDSMTPYQQQMWKDYLAGKNPDSSNMAARSAIDKMTTATKALLKVKADVQVIEDATSASLARNIELNKKAAELADKQAKDAGKVSGGTGEMPDAINKSKLNDEYNATLTKIRADVEAAKREFDNFEKNIQSKVKSGAMTEMDALTQVSEAHIKSYKKQADAYQRMLDVVAPENKLARQAEITNSMIAMQDKEAETANRLAEGMAVLYAKADQQRLDRRVKTLEALGKFEEAAAAKGAKLFETELRLNKAALAAAESSVKTDFVSDNSETFKRIAYYKEQIKSAEDEIEALRFEGKERDAKHAKEKLDEYLKDWKKIDNQIRDDLTDAILDGGGKGFKRLIRDMERAFAKMILKPILDPISGGIADIATGKNGSALRGVSDTLSIGSSIAGIGKTVGSAGSFFGSTSLAEFGAGMSGTAATEAAAYAAADAAAGMTVAAGAAETGLTAAASAGASFASALSTAVPWIAAAVVAYKVWTKFFEDGPESNTRLNFTSNNTPGNISINERGNEGKTNQSYIDGSGSSAFGTFGLSSTFWMNGAQKTVQDFITNVTKTDDVLAKFLTSAEQLSVIKNITGKTFIANTGAEGADPNATGQLDDVFARRLAAIMEGVEPGLSALTEGFKGTAQELASEAAALLQFRQALTQGGEAVFGVKVTLQEIAALKLPTEATSAALARVTGVFNITNNVLATLGKTSEEAFGKVGLASFELRNNLIIAAGGADKLSAATSFFMQNILSDEDRLVPVTKALHEGLVNLGLSADTTILQYKDLVRGQSLATEADQARYLALLDLAPAFKALDDAIGKTTDTTSKSAEIIKKQRELDIELMTALGHEEEATAAKRFDELKALTELSPALAKTQQAIYDATDASTALAKANKEAADAQAQLEKDVKKYYDLTLEILDLQGKSTEAVNLRRMEELSSLTDSQKALQLRIYALKDEAANLDKLRGNATLAYSVLDKAIKAAKDNAQAEYAAKEVIINAQKSSAEAIFKINKETLDKQKQDSSDAYEAFKKATSATLDTAKAANSAIKDLSTSIKSVLDIVKEVAGYSMSRATGQQIIADALAVARSTGILPTAASLKEALTAVGKAGVFSTQFDQTRDARITANNLQSLNDLTDTALSNSEQQLEVIQSSLELAKTAYDTQVIDFATQQDLAQKAYDLEVVKYDDLINVAKATLDAESLKYDLMLSYAKDQLDAMNGTQLAVMSVADALSRFNIAVNTAVAATQSSSNATVAASVNPQSATVDQVTKLYQSILKRNPDAEGLKFYTGTGESAASVANSLLHSTEYAMIDGSHADGLDRVPKDNYIANLHKDERVQTAKQARDADSTAEEIRQLRSDLQAQALSSIQIEREIMKILRKFDGEGLPTFRKDAYGADAVIKVHTV